MKRIPKPRGPGLSEWVVAAEDILVQHDQDRKMGDSDVLSAEPWLIEIVCAGYFWLWKNGSIERPFIMLQASEDVLISHVGGRQRHFIKVELVNGQLAIMETAGVEEGNFVPFDVGGVEEVVGVMGDFFWSRDLNIVGGFVCLVGVSGGFE